MQYFPIHQYVHNFWKIYILGHLTPCVYQFIGGDTEEKSNIIFISWIGTVYWNTILCWTFFVCMDHESQHRFFFNGDFISRFRYKSIFLRFCIVEIRKKLRYSELLLINLVLIITYFYYFLIYNYVVLNVLPYFLFMQY